MKSEEFASAEEYYQLGNEARKRGQWHEAINHYIQAIEIDPDIMTKISGKFNLKWEPGKKE